MTLKARMQPEPIVVVLWWRKSRSRRDPPVAMMEPVFCPKTRTARIVAEVLRHSGGVGEVSLGDHVVGSPSLSHSSGSQLAEKGKPLGRKLLAEMASLATPETILRWYRRKVAAKYDGTAGRRRPGRPRSHSDKVGELLIIARENPSWAYTRLRGALENLGLSLGRSTIQRILKEHGIEPAPVRGRGGSRSLTTSRYHYEPGSGRAPPMSRERPRPRPNSSRSGPLRWWAGPIPRVWGPE
jgi:transposase